VTFAEFLAGSCPELPAERVDAVLALVAEGFAPLFIARRCGDRTGGLGEAEVAAIVEAKQRYDALRERQRFVAEEIARQGKLDAGLQATIERTFDRDVLDEIYLPFKRKRRTPAAAALDAGLGPLADWIWNCGHGIDTPLPGQTLELWAFTFRSEEHGIGDAQAAIAGAEDVLVERLAESGPLRARLREFVQEEGWLAVTRGPRAKPDGKFTACFDLWRPLGWLRTPEGAATYLTIRRGVNEGELAMRLGGGPDDADLMDRLREIVERAAATVPDTPGASVLRRAAARALGEHLWPATEALVHKGLRTLADDIALADLRAELGRLLLAPPFGPRQVLGVDPAPRGGSKIAAVDGAGQLLEHGIVHLDSEENRARAGAQLVELATRHALEAVAVGDGLAGKETLRAVRGALRARGVTIPVVAVTELGLSAWARGEAARDELPDVDPTVRAAVGIARRLQDPLAELVRAEARTLAGGPYVHDLSQPRLEKALAATVASCVAEVGVDVNRAPDVLLARLPGVTPGLAHAIVEHRTAHGAFPHRAALRSVPLMDARSYEQLEPFVRVDGDGGPPDPRGVLEPVAFDPGLRTLADVRPGLLCPGVVTSVTSFGAFVDIGVPQDGLVHVSRLADAFVKDPHAVVRVGDRVQVRVVEVNLEKQQIALSMKREPVRPPPRAPRPAPAASPRESAARTRPSKPRPDRPAFNNPFADLAAQLRGGTPPRPKR
jgi:uncharacterized protein